ncbi:MAG TPA: NrfD/PsrC family molybdoenzyme membrane anchor subunit [Candidatus Omnitrophota bacterium]|nr:NrfD/PsrC family molybdoenzyme membrane anchor subunit [Candidatus Omnitrophota bacterium]
MKKIFGFFLWGFWIVLAVLGTMGLFERFVSGHKMAAYGSYVIWGLWVSAYIYFIGLSAGAFLLSSLIYVFGMHKLERIGKLSLFVAIITLFMALTSIIFDLGRMERFYYVYTSPNFGSMMAWMVWLYTVYFLVMLVEMWFAIRGDLARWSAMNGVRGILGRTLAWTKRPLTLQQEASARDWLKWLAAIGIPLAVAFHGGVGALFSTIAAHPFWHTPLMPILFLTGALVSGGALMAFMVSTFWPHRNEEFQQMVKFLGRVVVGLLLFDVVLEWAEFSVPMWYGVGHEYELLMYVLFGQFWWVFWILHVGCGIVIPLTLLTVKGDKPWAVGLAGLLIAMTFLTVRLNIVIPGLIDPNLRELQSAFVHPRLMFSYMPSFFEWQVTMFIVAIGMALTYLGFKFLPLTETHEIKGETYG